ncbi:MAG TPA: dTDP-4-dehydrorhamnose reductase, partial [Euryarchaeota archaeon]|nr:dTDP-4-dehydrorhamnose reductase [Euryarchaeota archaeon]
MKVAVIGATGQLGSDLVKAFGEDAVPLGHEDIEVRSLSGCINALKFLPEVVINCAAYVRVDDAEDEAEEAFAVNAAGAKNVAIACESIGAVNVYIGTDYVFDGKKGEPYVESDLPNPINVYSLSKYVGEIFTRNYSSRYYIPRVSSLYGVKGARGKGGNFVETMIKKAENREEIKVVGDMIMSPTYTRDVADIIHRILKQNLPYGIYHCSNSGSCSWLEFASAIFSFMNFGIAIKSISYRELNLKAARPENSSLESEKLEKYGIKPRNWRDAL